MSKGPIYLDNAATSWPKPPEVGAAMAEFLTHHAGNPGRGGHRLAREAQAVVERARTKLAGLIGAESDQRVVLTHGCTDSVNLAIHGALRSALKCCGGERPKVVATVTEHNAVLRTIQCYAGERLIDLHMVGCDGSGLVDPAEVALACDERTRLVCCSHASNVLGTVQDVATIGAAVRERSPRALFLVDAAQTVGHLAIDVEAAGIDLLSIAGHKGLLGPTGTGALYVGPRSWPDDPELPRLLCERRGGTGAVAPGLEMPCTLPDALEAGTVNAVGFAGLCAAIDAHDGMDLSHELGLVDRLAEGLAGRSFVRVHPPARAHGRMPVLSFTVDGMAAREVACEIDRRFDIAVRGGTHCAPMLHEAIGTGVGGAVRASPGPRTTVSEIDALLGALDEVCCGVAG